jgi:metal-responsive CopG/Arc/MetJ family transcriptional regulator
MSMKNLSLKLEDNTFNEVEDIVSKINKKRNKYINEAVRFYNKLYKRKLMRSLLLEESEVAYGSSLDILKEFEEIEDDGFLLD